MEWYHWITPASTVLGLVAVWAVNHYRIGQAEKKIDQNKCDQDTKCTACRASQRDQKLIDEARIQTWQSMMQKMMDMHTAQVISNAQEHSNINIGAARTEEQLKSILAKIEDLTSAVHRIERDMRREYQPSPESETHERRRS